MSQFYAQPQPPYNPQPNLQFYQSTYSAQPVSGHSTPSQAQYGASYPSHPGATSSSYPPNGSGFGVGAGGPASFGHAGVAGRMGEQGGLRTGWLAAFGTEGYEGEPPLLEELGVNFGHIKIKVYFLLKGFPRCGIAGGKGGLRVSEKLLSSKSQCQTLRLESIQRPQPPIPLLAIQS